jgi:hypothetical protein
VATAEERDIRGKLGGHRDRQRAAAQKLESAGKVSAELKAAHDGFELRGREQSCGEVERGAS